MRRATIAALAAAALLAAGCGGDDGGGGGGDTADKAAKDFFASLPSGYKYEELSPADQKAAEQRFATGPSKEGVEEFAARRVTKDGKLVAAVIVVKVKEGLDEGDIGKGFQQGAGGQAKDVTLDGKDAQQLQSPQFNSIFDSADGVFIAIFGQDAAEVKSVATPLVL